jgi:uncharacterized damage-inducible protein DinB
MSTTSAQAAMAMPSPKQQFLDAYEREHATTMRVLRAFPTDKLELQPHPKSKTARELAWLFAMECMLGMGVWNDTFIDTMGQQQPAPPPQSYDELVAGVEKAHRQFADMIGATPDSEMMKKVRFFSGPKTVGEFERLQFAWFLLCDEIHHRGQFSIYLRMAGGRVPSIYGPTADEPWT